MHCNRRGTQSRPRNVTVSPVRNNKSKEQLALHLRRHIGRPDAVESANARPRLANSVLEVSNSPVTNFTKRNTQVFVAADIRDSSAIKKVQSLRWDAINDHTSRLLRSDVQVEPDCVGNCFKDLQLLLKCFCCFAEKHNIVGVRKSLDVSRANCDTWLEEPEDVVDREKEQKWRQRVAL